MPHANPHKSKEGNSCTRRCKSYTAMRWWLAACWKSGQTLSVLSTIAGN